MVLKTQKLYLSDQELDHFFSMHRRADPKHTLGLISAYYYFPGPVEIYVHTEERWDEIAQQHKSNSGATESVMEKVTWEQDICQRKEKSAIISFLITVTELLSRSNLRKDSLLGSQFRRAKSLGRLGAGLSSCPWWWKASPSDLVEQGSRETGYCSSGTGRSSCVRNSSPSHTWEASTLILKELEDSWKWAVVERVRVG